MKLTTEAVVTMEMEKWGQQLQAFHIPSTSTFKHASTHEHTILTFSTNTNTKTKTNTKLLLLVNMVIVSQDVLFK